MPHPPHPVAEHSSSPRRCPSTLRAPRRSRRARGWRRRWPRRTGGTRPGGTGRRAWSITSWRRARDTCSRRCRAWPWPTPSSLSSASSGTTASRCARPRPATPRLWPHPLSHAPPWSHLPSPTWHRCLAMPARPWPRLPAPDHAQLPQPHPFMVPHPDWPHPVIWSRPHLVIAPPHTPLEPASGHGHAAHTWWPHPPTWWPRPFVPGHAPRPC